MDINKMSMKDFHGIMWHLDIKEREDNNQVIPLPDASREMIRRAREKDKLKKENK